MELWLQGGKLPACPSSLKTEWLPELGLAALPAAVCPSVLALLLAFLFVVFPCLGLGLSAPPRLVRSDEPGPRTRESPDLNSGLPLASRATGRPHGDMQDGWSGGADFTAARGGAGRGVLPTVVVCVVQ